MKSGTQPCIKQADKNSNHQPHLGLLLPLAPPAPENKRLSACVRRHKGVETSWRGLLRRSTDSAFSYSAIVGAADMLLLFYAADADADAVDQN